MPTVSLMGFSLYYDERQRIICMCKNKSATCCSTAQCTLMHCTDISGSSCAVKKPPALLTPLFTAYVIGYLSTQTPTSL